MFEVVTAEDASRETSKLSNHVIVGGYGFAGRELSGALKSCGIPYVVVDLNVENVRKATQDGVDAFFGDVTNHEVLLKLGVKQAKELVLLVNDPTAAEQALRVARKLAPELFIVVRTHYLLDVESILAAGADEVIPSEREAAVEVTARVLGRHEVDRRQIDAQRLDIRTHTEEENS